MKKLRTLSLAPNNWALVGDTKGACESLEKKLENAEKKSKDFKGVLKRLGRECVQSNDHHVIYYPAVVTPGRFLV